MTGGGHCIINESLPDTSIVAEVLAENARRRERVCRIYDPVAGDPSDGPRQRVEIAGMEPAVMWLPSTMLEESWVSELAEAGSVTMYLAKSRSGMATAGEVTERFRRLRVLHDFPYWAANYVYIKRKGGGEDILFRLNAPQRRLVEAFESQRRAGKPIRLILLKARQWGGSTCAQLYMAWLQLVHLTGLNSLIVAHQSAATEEIKDMYDRMMKAYPPQMLLEPGQEWESGEKKTEGVGRSGSAFRVGRRNCKVKVGTAERPDSCRGGDYSLVHCSEVGIWKATKGKSPEQLLRSACSGVLLKPMTMIVYESTANGTGNFFHREYESARRGESQFKSLFISWYEIEQYSLDFDDDGAREEFARVLVEGRHGEQALSERKQPGRYLWLLWERGATLEAIHWYVAERAKYHDHGLMAAEYPSDDVEAFVHSGARVFDKYRVEELRKGCRAPTFRGAVCGDKAWGPESLRNVRFVADSQGSLAIWSKPDRSGSISERYLAVVDIGGRSAKADWSVVVVFDRRFMAGGGVPSVVAQWKGHSDIDLLAWNAARIAAYYDNALLVVESNTLETHDADRSVEGDQSHFILNRIREAYPRLYARRQSAEDIMQGRPRKFGFHTNRATKPMIITHLVQMVREGLYAERDEGCLDEYLTYECRPDGSYAALPGRHDDMLMTRAIGLHICYNEMPLPASATSSEDWTAHTSGLFDLA